MMYPSIHAKLKGMYAQKLKKEQLDELLKQNTIVQAIALLKSFNENFKDLKQDSNRINIKMLLDDILIKDIQKIYRLLNHKQKLILLQFISIYEIKCIKNVFRKLSSGSSIGEQTSEVENWTSKLFKDLVGISEVKTYEEFLYFLKKTRYYKLFEKYDAGINEIEIFEIENKLDKFYFESMMKIAKKQTHDLEDMIGKQIDLNHIVWIYRMKKNYGFTKLQIQQILVDVHYHLKTEELEQLIQANEQEMKQILQKTYYGKYLDFDQMEDLEQQISQYLYQTFKKYLKGNIFGISAIYAYFYIVELENNDIMNILEGIRYHLKPDEIQKKLL